MGPEYQIQYEDSSYHNSMPSLASENQAFSVLAAPRRAITKDLPQHLRLQPMTDIDLTPPPSPQSNASNTSKFVPLLSRASSVLGRRSNNSRQTSPARRQDSTLYSPLREPIPENRETAAATPRASKFASTAVAFSELFQGTSELVNTWSFKPQEASLTTLTRPSHSRTNTSKSFRSGIFSGWNASPTREPEEVTEDDDEIMNLNIDEELFRGGPSKTSAEAMDTLVGNAERLFMQMQMAHSRTLRKLNAANARASRAEDELAEERARSDSFKAQLSSIDGELAEQEERCSQLQADLDEERWQRRVEQESRARTIRAVEPEPSLTVPGKDGHRLFSGEHGDSMYSLTQAGLDLSDGESAGGSPLWSPPITPEDSRPASVEPYGPSRLVEENNFLKGRIAQLEDTIEGCLGLVETM